MSGLTGLNPYGALNVTSSYKEGDISEKDVEELLEGRCLYDKIWHLQGDPCRQ